MYRLLLVEDDPGIAAAVREHAAQWELEVSLVEDFRHVMDSFARVQPHLVLMDITLPFYSGYYWCQEIRKIAATPVMFLSSAADNMNIVLAMNMGADDFVAKPFDMDVLVAKVQALLRRSYDFYMPAPALEHHGAQLSATDGTLTYAGQKIDLTKNEHRILLCLMQQKGRVVSRERLMERLWETDQYVDDNTLTVNINRLRKKLNAAGLTEFITTQTGVGYAIK